MGKRNKCANSFRSSLSFLNVAVEKSLPLMLSCVMDAFLASCETASLALPSMSLYERLISLRSA